MVAVNEIDKLVYIGGCGHALLMNFYIGRHPGAHAVFAVCNVLVAYVAPLYGTYRYVSITAPTPTLFVSL